MRDLTFLLGKKILLKIGSVNDLRVLWEGIKSCFQVKIFFMKIDTSNVMTCMINCNIRIKSVWNEFEMTGKQNIMGEGE